MRRMAAVTSGPDWRTMNCHADSPLSLAVGITQRPAIEGTSSLGLVRVLWETPDEVGHAVGFHYGERLRRVAPTQGGGSPAAVVKPDGSVVADLPGQAHLAQD